MRGAGWRLVALAAALGAARCGTDYVPPDLPTTGRIAPALGEQVLDLEIALPALLPTGHRLPGVFLELRLEIDGSGFGEHPARAFFSGAVEDLSDGATWVLVTPDRWTLGPVGPLRIANSVFELLLDGTAEAGGGTVSGVVYETQTATSGSFTGWRRHRFLVAETDFFSDYGRVAEVSWIKDREILVRDDLELISSDAVVRVTGGGAFVVNRLSFDNLQRLDPPEDFATAWQLSLVPGANPHDVLQLDDGRLWVTRYEPPFDDVAVIDPSELRIVGSIPLAALAENPDGTPRADRLARAAGAVFVGLQEIDRTFTRFAEGKLAVLDPALGEVVGTVRLGGKNPGEIEVVRGADGRERLYVALAGIFAGLQPQELSGGVVVVDAFDRVVERWALDDDDAGGNVAGLALVSERLGYVLVADSAFHNSVLAFDPATGAILRTVWQSTSFVPEVEVDGGGILAIPDRSFATPRVCLWRAPADDGGAEVGLGCAALLLPPASLEALD